MDGYIKGVLTVLVIVFTSIAVNKDIDLFSVAEAQQGWELIDLCSEQPWT